MKTATFALIVGIVYIALGILALVPVSLAPPPADAPATSFALLYGYLLGLFPVNILQTALHIAFGYWGLCAWREKCSAVGFARALASTFGALALLGLLPGANTLFGLMPLYGNDVWLHGLTAIAAAYFGWRAHSATAGERRRSGQDRRRLAIPVARERRFGLADRREILSAAAAG